MGSLLLAAGCAARVPDRAAIPEGPVPPPVLLHLPGIAGEMPVDRRLVRGLVQAGVAPEGQILDWTGEARGLRALGDLERNRKQARKLADRIITIARRDPRTRIVLSGHSGGTGIAVWALELLPADVKIDRLLLLAPALSPTYDLSRALAHVAGHAHAFYSPHDSLVLQYGTLAFGTIDRQYVPAAGYAGFVVPRDAEASERYAKLTQHPYDPAWLQLGHPGDHIGALAPQFVQAVIAPLLHDDRPEAK